MFESRFSSGLTVANSGRYTVRRTVNYYLRRKCITFIGPGIVAIPGSPDLNPIDYAV